MTMTPTVLLLFAQLLGWQWAGAVPGFGHSFYQAPRSVSAGQVVCTFTYDHAKSTTRTACASNGRELWHTVESHAFDDDAALLIDSGTLYSARYSDISSGCKLHAFDLTTGRERWAVSLDGLGPIAHSEYLCSVQVSMVNRNPTVFGWESAGRYIEARDAATGARTVHQILRTP